MSAALAVSAREVNVVSKDLGVGAHCLESYTAIHGHPGLRGVSERGDTVIRLVICDTRNMRGIGQAAGQAIGSFIGQPLFDDCTRMTNVVPRCIRQVGKWQYQFCKLFCTACISADPTVRAAVKELVRDTAIVASTVDTKKDTGDSSGDP
jgi:hypothetical protein